MRIVYPLLWSQLGREANREQSVATAAAFARQGAQVTLVLPQGEGDRDLQAGEARDYFGVSGDFALVQRPSRWGGTHVVQTALWMREVMRDPAVAGADLLYSRVPWMLAAGGLSPIPFAVEHYRPWPDDWPFIRPLVRRTARQPHCLGFILHSDYAAESYRRIGIDAERVMVARNGADLERFAAPASPGEARARLGLPVDRRIAVYAGSINPEKAIDQILALADLSPEVLFLLVGSEGEGPVQAEARRRANVRVFPWQDPDSLPDYLHAADVLLIPASTRPLLESRRCVLPIKTYAYLAAGRPILAPRAPDTAELLRDRENAVLVAPERPDEAAAALAALLADPLLAQRVSAGAAETARGLSWDARARLILTFLDRRLSQARGGEIAAAA